MVTKGLNRNERLIIILYYYEELTMKEIGATLDLSESRVSQMHSSIIQRLQSQLTPPPRVRHLTRPGPIVPAASPSFPRPSRARAPAPGTIRGPAGRALFDGSAGNPRPLLGFYASPVRAGVNIREIGEEVPANVRVGFVSEDRPGLRSPWSTSGSGRHRPSGSGSSFPPSIEDRATQGEAIRLDGTKPIEETRDGTKPIWKGSWGRRAGESPVSRSRAVGILAAHPRFAPPGPPADSLCPAGRSHGQEAGAPRTGAFRLARNPGTPRGPVRGRLRPLWPGAAQVSGSAVHGAALRGRRWRSTPGRSASRSPSPRRSGGPPRPARLPGRSTWSIMARVPRPRSRRRPYGRQVRGDRPRSP